ncbi:hypothetical protein [Alkalihalobacillus sp. LMS39]|uniref:hypothetical protein n=1 Tax=Alkalihalobacillus sp. LMS39 TaxID=2924032 RepID=UPI001FB4B9E5|nr:hypothetical protein [Alkalihalobacillus sp. LMS39]UOE94742.1 hypothetical protein MM271_03595 [Alkalihalobacillus sp. LMS39]
MSRKFGLMAVYLFIFVLAVYLAYDFLLFESSSMNSFLEAYLGNFQTYLYVFTLLLIPIILFHHVNYLKAEYLSRIKPSLLKYIIKKSIFNSLQTTFVFYFSFISGAVILRLHFDVSILILLLFIQLFIFILACFLLYHAIYLLTFKPMLGLFCIIFTNFSFSVSGFAFGFLFISDDDVFYEIYYYASMIYIVFILITSLISLALTVKKKECYT